MMKRLFLPILLPVRPIVFLLTFIACAIIVKTDVSQIGHWWSMIAVVVNILYRFLSFQPLTIILCWFYYIKRNPLPIMVGHALIDLATAAQILATSTIPCFYETLCGM